MTDLLRSELGFDGMVITDGLEMRAISDGVGIAEGAVLALIAGCDALCIGGGLADEDIVDELRSAIITAVRTGRLAEQRLVEAASRVDRLAAWRSTQHNPHSADREIGLAAARRAIRADGPVGIGRDAVIVQLIPGSTMASGLVPWGVAEPLAQLGSSVTALEFTGPPVDIEAILAKGVRRSLVLVVRDLHRHQWVATATEALLARRPDTVVIEMGLPACRPAGAIAYIATHGSARVCGLAAAERLMGLS
jgi:beta-N-acetylhexosaminidase